MTTISNNYGDKLLLKVHQCQIELLNNPNKQSISNYSNLLIELFNNENFLDEKNNIDSNNLLEFLIFPIITCIKKLQTEQAKVNTNINREWSDMHEILLKSIALILNKLKLTNSSLFSELIDLSSILLSKNTFNKASPKTLSEEFYIECFKLITVLFQCSSTSKILDEFFKFKNLKYIGLYVSISLDVLVDSNSIEVRLEALNSLKSLSCYDETEKSESDHTKRIGLIFAPLLPGITIKLIQKFLLSKNLKTLNQKLITGSLQFLGHLISNIFNDDLLNETYYCIYFNQSMNLNEMAKDNNELNKIKEMIINRNDNKEWLSNSSSKLFVLIHRLLDQLIISENYNVQIVLVKFCSIITRKCYFSLNDHLSYLFKILVMFAADQINSDKTTDDLSNLALISLEKIENLEKKEINNNQNVDSNFVLQNRFSIMNSSIEEILLKLPRLLKSSNNIDQQFKLRQLNALYGYLKLIGSNNRSLSEFFQSNMKNLNHLVEALISCISFDFKNINNFYSLENNDLNATTVSNYIGLKTYLDDKLVFDQLSLICEYLGKSNAARLLIDEILNNNLVLLQHEQNYCELMFLVNLIMDGVSKNSKSKNIDELISVTNLVLSSFINEYKSKTYDSKEIIQKVSIDNENSNSSLINVKNRKIIQTCLLIESIRISSECYLASTDLNKLLIETLFFVLENYLNSNLLIRVVATKCLNDIAINFKYKNIQDLLSANYDYIMNDLILKSNMQNRQIKSNLIKANNSAESQPSHVFILCSLLDISNSDLLAYLDRLIDDYFISIEINSNNLNLLSGICQIMKHISYAIGRWFPIHVNYLKINNHLMLEHSENSFINFDYVEYASQKKMPDYKTRFSEKLKKIDESFIKFQLENENYSKNSEEFENSDSEDQEKDKKVQFHIKILLKCLRLCTNLVSHPSKEVRLYLVDLIRDLCKNLSQNTNEFLPMVHKLWSPLCQRFNLDDYVVKSKIIYLLFDLSLLCGDFLGSRFIKEFLPKLCLFMKQQSKISLNFSINDPTYVYSQAYKLQTSILTNIDKMCILLDIKEIELEVVINDIVLTHLDKRQPKKLQILAVDSIKNCSLIDPDIIWLCLHYVLPFNNVDIKHSSFIKPKYTIQYNDEIFFDITNVFKNL